MVNPPNARKNCKPKQPPPAPSVNRRLCRPKLPPPPPLKECRGPYKRPPKENSCQHLCLTPSTTSTPKFENCGSRNFGDNVSRISIGGERLMSPKDPALLKGPNYRVNRKFPSESLSEVCEPLKKKDESSVNVHYQDLIFNVSEETKKQASSSTTPSLVEEKILKHIRTGEKQGSSQDLTDTLHQRSKIQLNLHGKEWRKPCAASVIAGAPKPFVGLCPPNFGEIAKMSRERQKFFLTQDPRKVMCLVNPDALRTKAFSEKKEFDALTKMVKYGDNLCDEAVSQSEESFICEVIDQENPMQLDFQGLDYNNTYQNDEQDLENQRVYRKVCRYMERRRVMKETAKNVEREIHKQMVSIPKCFEVQDRNSVAESEPSIASVRYGKLFRSTQKPENKARIAKEKQERKDRYEKAYMASKKKKEAAEKESKQKDALAQENLPTTLAITNFNQANKKINDAIQRSFHKQTMLKRKETTVRDFPHTITETKRFKKQLKKENRIRRDHAIVKRDFNEALGKIKTYPELDLEISSNASKASDDSELSVQSTDDEDEIVVGRKGDKFLLRGFHFKLGDNLRGKLHQRERQAEKHRVRDCQTRDDWLKEILPKKISVKPDVYVGIQRPRSADDPNLVLFHPEHGFRVPKPQESNIQKYIQKKLGKHYERVLRKNLKLAKPRLPYSVKKFNFIQFRYGKTKDIDLGEERKLDEQFMSTFEYIHQSAKKREQEKLRLKKERLDLLGIPCTEIKKSRLQIMCENSESSDSDWVPEHESARETHKDGASSAAASSINSSERERLKGGLERGSYNRSSAVSHHSHHTESQQSLILNADVKEKSKSYPLTMRMRGNMPAPKYREPTLRHNRNRPRDYAKERVPSAEFVQAVKKSNVPILHKLPPEERIYENVREKKKPYTKMLEARHHHDHWNPTDNRVVHVQYKPKTVAAKITETKQKTKEVISKFKKAYPPCNNFVDMDLTIPNYHIDEMVKANIEQKMQYVEKKQGTRKEDKCHPYDFVFHSRAPEELEGLRYPGHREFVEFLRDIKKSLADARDTKPMDGDEQKLNVNREELIKELEEDLKSIQSCLSSMSSSICTNLTNDSGSFLLLEGKTKLPLDYVRKAVVPFEELQRSRFRAEVIDVDKEEENPFRVVPFPGQKKEQIENNAPKDSFFTFSTRLQNGMRLRLEVPVEDVRQKLLGTGPNKHFGAVTTDIDENYITELKNSPAVKSCKFKTGAVFLKDALRMKFESMLIQGQIVRTKIFDRLNEQHWEGMLRVKMLFEKLFVKWEKREYEAAMDVVYQVKSYYDITDKLRIEHHDLERDLTQLNMDIVFLEAHWIRCIQLQNFHYLMADQEWRVKNDWIHRIEIQSESGSEVEHVKDEHNIEMESFDVSIAKRPYINIRDREKDDAWAIKAYYYNVYMQNLHPIMTVFPDYQSFLRGVENLKAKTFVLLLEMHFTLSIHTELQGRFQTFQDWCTQDLYDKQEYVARKCAKKYFMDARAEEMKTLTKEFLGKPIEDSFCDKKLLHDNAIILEVWRQMVPENQRGSETNTKSIEMVGMMMDVVIEILNRFENLPTDVVMEVEDAYRKERAHQFKISRQAYQVEKRVETGMRKVMQNLEPIKKPKRRFKAPRTFIKKKVETVVEAPKHISDHTKFFYQAFHDDADVPQAVEARESLVVIDTMQEHIVPFYFDHFLKLNGYTPNYNFKTQTELRDGPEVKRLLVQSVVPDLMQKMEIWELSKRRIMEEQIARNPQMYENVK